MTRLTEIYSRSERFESIKRRMEKSAENPVKPKLGWRDYLTRQRVGTIICLAGLTISTLSARNFANNLSEIFENFGQERAYRIETESAPQDYKALETLARKSTGSLEADACLTIGGAALAITGYVTARHEEKRRWPPRISAE